MCDAAGSTAKPVEIHSVSSTINAARLAILQFTVPERFPPTQQEEQNNTPETDLQGRT